MAIGVFSTSRGTSISNKVHCMPTMKRSVTKWCHISNAAYIASIGPQMKAVFPAMNNRNVKIPEMMVPTI